MRANFEKGTKVCSRCRLEQSLECFRHDKSRFDGFDHRCKVCVEARRKTSLSVKKYNQKYRKSSKYKIYDENRRATPAYKSAEKIRKSTPEYKASDCKRAVRYKAQRRKIDPFFKFTGKLRTLIRLEIKSGGFTKRSKTFQILGCTFEEFRAYFEPLFRTGMTWENHGEWHIDHIVPMATAKTKEEALKLNHYTNLRPLWATENLKKGARV